MPLQVWSPRALEAEFEAPLRAALDVGVRLTTGPDPPPEYEVLVDGLPTREALGSSHALRALVIPYAGLPARTRELLSEFPGLAVHNLHHNAAPTAETALALLLAAAKQLVPADRDLRRGDWAGRYGPRTARLLEGRRALILGYGHVGRRVGRACAALGMQVRGVRRRPDPAAEDELPPEALAEHLGQADALVICLPSTPDTKGLVGARELARLPRGALLVNVGRADVVEERALYGALRSRALGAAGLDVWYRYPRSEEERATTFPSAFPFHELEHVVMSPHRASRCDAIEELRALHLARLLSALARGGGEESRVDPARGY